jgi:beta-lactamase class A
MSAASRQQKLQALVSAAVQKALADFPGEPQPSSEVMLSPRGWPIPVQQRQKLLAEELAITLVDLHNPAKPISASHRGDVQIYPASVIKVFYVVAAHQWMEEGRMPDTPEMRRAMHDTIVYSYNESTSYIVDWLTGTTSGPELPPAELDAWHNKRNAVNRYFSLLGYTNINANKKPWGEGPYGRETQAIAAYSPKRNWLTTEATARLMAEIATCRAVTAERSKQIMELLKRDFSPATSHDPALSEHADQAREFTALGLPSDARLWSKAGWMSTERHDAAYIELAGGARFVLITFTSNHSNEKDIIPTVTHVVAEGMAEMYPGESSKFRAPSTREASSSNLQPPR